MREISGDELTSQLPSSRQLALLNFAKTRINSFIKWDLVKFFYLNTYTLDTVENIAKYIGRNRDVVEQEIEGLVEDGILEKRILGNRPVYMLTTKAAIRPMVDLFVLACEDRVFRIKATDQIIQRMRRIVMVN